MAIQNIQQAQGRPMLQWAGKRPLERIEYYPAQEKEVYGKKDALDFNKIFWGDNLQVLAHLLKDYRGKFDLIYIDPPFGTGVDYFKKIRLRGEEIKSHYNLFEEKQYANVFEIDYFLQFMYERLLLMRELLSDTGSIFIRFDYHFSHYIKIVADEVFGQDNFLNEITLKRSRNEAGSANKLEVTTESIVLYRKTERATLNKIQVKRSIANVQWTDFQMAGDRNPPQRHFFGMEIFPPKGQHFSLSQEKTDRVLKENYLRLSCRGCGAKYYHAENDAALNKRMKVAKNRFKFYDITNQSTYYGVTQLSECLNCKENIFKVEYLGSEDVTVGSNWIDIASYTSTTGYPTENSEALLERVIKIGSKEGDLVADFFAGSGSTAAVAQKLGRRWITCDINLGSVQTTAKRLSNVVEGQHKKPAADFAGSLGFKICNVNDYEVFRSEVEAKEVVMDIYGIDPIKRSYFDGVLGTSFVKIMPMNRVLNKLDIKNILKSTEEQLQNFTVKSSSASGEAIFEQGVIVLCSGTELDVFDYLKRENTTGVKVEIRDLLTDKQSLIFKKRPEAEVTYTLVGRRLTVAVEQFYSPILLRKLEAENQKVIREEYRARVEDFRQVVDSIALDIDYNGDLFNAEIVDIATKKEVVKATYNWEYDKPGKYRVAVKVVDVLGEEYFETHELEVV